MWLEASTGVVAGAAMNPANSAAIVRCQGVIFCFISDLSVLLFC